ADAIFDGNTLTLPSRSRALLEDIQLLLTGFGVKASIGAGDSTSEIRHQATKLLELVSGDGGAVTRAGAPHSATRRGGSPDDADGGNTPGPRHGLRIDPGSL